MFITHILPILYCTTQLCALFTRLKLERCKAIVPWAKDYYDISDNVVYIKKAWEVKLTVHNAEPPKTFLI